MANTVICLVVAVEKDDLCKELKQSFGEDCKVYKFNARVSFVRVEATIHSYGAVESLKGDSKMHWFCPETGDDSGMYHAVNAQLDGVPEHIFSDELMGH